ncbi:ABC-type multidrug transport system, ATPase component [Actinacidiphila yanglinensis]|uniref:ABC-type multidrug transport system, ATPase component n=1 Tax=Actinacidiphila yanglinensis TaxID=310779 RepID=A0A1H5XBB5_9ACTN|nr:ATP-binding cassette domain-containing protein [Actinacidiphila yanglinensis]SEG09029.1 ABC-type multidrug transport system, ATPase component [Actinacidiphila yanglinensis]
MLDANGPRPEGLRLDEVGRRYGLRGPWVLRDVTLDAPGGSLVRVEGANGSGKSTLLRIVAGVDRPTSGRLLGRPAAGTAYVPERFPAALPFPVLRYLTHLGAIRGLPPDLARARAQHWLERFGVAGHARTPLDQLSKGTSQKVAVAQALLADPELLVLDEAWTGLDTSARAVLDDVVRERAGAGATVFYVDHDPHRLAGEATAVYAVAGGGEVRQVAGGAGPYPYRDTAAGHVVIEAAGDGEVPPAVRPFGPRPAVGGRLTVEAPAGESDGVLRALLGAEPPWHIEAVRTSAPPPGPPVPGATPPARETAGAAPAGRPRRTLGALVRYQSDLMLRSHRWLPPLLLYGAVMGIGVAGGQPLLGSLGYAGALLLPVAAWLVRVCATGEPGAARACTASAVGPGRAHLGALLAALAASTLLALAGTGVVAVVSGAHTDDLTVAVPVGPAVLAGLMAAAVSVLLGTAVGALTNPPLLPGTGWSVLVTGFFAGAVLLTTGSPAQAAVTSLVHGSQTGAVHYPVVALVGATCAAVAALWVSVRAVARLGAARP